MWNEAHPMEMDVDMDVDMQVIHLDDLPTELLELICEFLNPLYLKQLRLTSKILSHAATRYLFRKLYITFCIRSYRNVLIVSERESLRNLVHELVWDLREIQIALTKEFEFMAYFKDALVGLSGEERQFFRGVHDNLYHAQCSLKTTLQQDMEQLEPLREALRRFSHIKKISMIQPPDWNMMAIPMSLRLSSGMLFQYGTWALASSHPVRRGTVNDYIVGSWPLKVALQCLMPSEELSILAYSGNWSTIAGLLIAGHRDRSSLRHLRRLDINLFMPHGGPFFWHGFIEAGPTLRDSKLNGCYAALESINLSFKTISDPNPQKNIINFGSPSIPIDRAYFPQLRAFTLESFWMWTSDFKSFLRKHAATLRSLSVRKALLLLGNLGEILESMRESQMKIESGSFEDVFDDSFWRRMNRLTVQEAQLLDFLAGKGPNPCPIPSSGPSNT